MWLILSLGSAVGLALQSVYLKRNTFHFNSFIIIWSLLVISSLLYLPFFLFVKLPQLNFSFWVAVIARLFIDSAGLIFYVKGLKISPLSLATPLVSLVPVLMIFTSFFINHLFPTSLGLIGIFVTFVGIYLLNFDHDTKHILSPFIALKNNRGLQYILIFVISQALVSSLQRLAIDNSNVYFYTPFFQLLWAILFTPLTFFINKREFTSVFSRQNFFRLFPIGALDAFQVFVMNIAFTLTLPVYVNTVQNTSIILSSLFGWYFFKEKIDKHVIPTIIIVAGIILITFAQK